MKPHHSTLLKFKKAKYCKVHNTSAEADKKVLVLIEAFLKSNLHRNQGYLQVTATVSLYPIFSKTIVRE